MTIAHQVVLATRNAKKLAELRRIVAAEAPEVQVLDWPTSPPIPASRDRAHLRGQCAAQGPSLRRSDRPACAGRRFGSCR